MKNIDEKKGRNVAFALGATKKKLNKALELLDSFLEYHERPEFIDERDIPDLPSLLASTRKFIKQNDPDSKYLE